jgi:hypothetical protein
MRMTKALRDKIGGGYLRQALERGSLANFTQEEIDYIIDKVSK